MNVPKYDELMNPTLRALHNLGGSATINELVEEVAKILELSQETLEVPSKAKGMTQFEYRLAWTRTYLKKAGLLTNSERGVWALTAEGQRTHTVDSQAVKRQVRQMRRHDPVQDENTDDDDDGGPIAEEQDEWRETVRQAILSLAPDGFERLCQRLLRESGFIQVEVTGRSGDGGIDGHGIVKIAGLLSFPTIFQAKRYAGSVGAGEIRNFRGAMVGRADKGLFITTGSFTSTAYMEATRDGAPPIDLIDGQQLAEKLKELGLGVTTRIVEAVDVDTEWFRSI